MLARVWDLFAGIKQFLQERGKHHLLVQFSHGFFKLCNSHNLYVKDRNLIAIPTTSTGLLPNLLCGEEDWVKKPSMHSTI